MQVFTRYHTLVCLVILDRQKELWPSDLTNDALIIVKLCIKVVDDTGHNVRFDHLFISIPLANDLYANHKMTIGETFCKNKHETSSKPLDLFLY